MKYHSHKIGPKTVDGCKWTWKFDTPGIIVLVSEKFHYLI